MSFYVIVVLLINATTGEPQGEYVSGKPMRLEACAQALIKRGPVPVRDGTAQMMVCRKLKGEVRL